MGKPDWSADEGSGRGASWELRMHRGGGFVQEGGRSQQGQGTAVSLMLRQHAGSGEGVVERWGVRPPSEGSGEQQGCVRDGHD